jgi:nucleoside 2-deoxyribosyltransferase
MRPKIYCAGPIAQKTYDQSELWRNEFKALVEPHIECFSPLRGKQHLRAQGVLCPSAIYSDPLCTDRGILIRDHLDCMRADLIVCNLLDLDLVTIGSVMECAWAYAYRKPLILIMADQSVHDHPMLRAVTDYRVLSVAHAAELSLSILLS